MLASTLSQLGLSEPQSIGYTLKCLGAGFYGLRKGGADFRGTIRDVVMEAGDADTNGAVCGALLGCAVGFSALPEDLLAFPHREWLDSQVERFLQVIGLGGEPLQHPPEEGSPVDPHVRARSMVEPCVSAFHACVCCRALSEERSGTVDHAVLFYIQLCACLLLCLVRVSSEDREHDVLVCWLCGTCVDGVMPLFTPYAFSFYSDECNRK